MAFNFNYNYPHPDVYRGSLFTRPSPPIEQSVYVVLEDPDLDVPSTNNVRTKPVPVCVCYSYTVALQRVAEGDNRYVIGPTLINRR